MYIQVASWEKWGFLLSTVVLGNGVKEYRSFFWFSLCSACPPSTESSPHFRLSCSPATTISWSGKSSKQSAAADSHSSNLKNNIFYLLYDQVSNVIKAYFNSIHLYNSSFFLSSVQKKLLSINQRTNWGSLRESGNSLSRHVLEITKSWVARAVLQAWGWTLAGEVRMQSSMGNSIICSSCSNVCCFQTSSTTWEGGKSRKEKIFQISL